MDRRTGSQAYNRTPLATAIFNVTSLQCTVASSYVIAPLLILLHILYIGHTVQHEKKMNMDNSDPWGREALTDITALAY